MAAIVEQKMPDARPVDDDIDKDDDDDDCSMPEFDCDAFSVADLGRCRRCSNTDEDDDDDDADDEGASAAAAAAAGRHRRGSAPRRLSLQQRRRLNLYSKPAPGLPAALSLRLQHQQPQQQPQQQPKAAPAATSKANGSLANRDTPTIHEEDSGFGSVTSPDVPEEDEEMPAAAAEAAPSGRRGRTVSEPPDSDGGASVAAARKPPGGVAARLRTVSHSHHPSTSAGSTSRWPGALNLVFQNLRNDLWRSLPVSKRPEETATRHRYNAHKRQWLHDTVCVKVEQEPFNRGAMRECFRLKKLSGFSKYESWHSRACNYVAKRYIESVDPSVYFEDVRLQMNAKLWAQEYNRHHPPKKVDIMQMCVIQFNDREGAPLYHLEHHIEGEYVKHNSNSGFVDDNARRTPHALSHFTFERSGHQLIVVDIQGVDDIYTDPQIHTAEGKEYGDGNLGVRGMALFFSTHVCNDICRRLGLSRFDMAPSEVSEPPSPVQTDFTFVRSDVFAIGSPPAPQAPAAVSAVSVSPPSVLDSGCSSTDDDSSDASLVGGRAGRRRRTTSSDEMTPLTETDELGPEDELAALSAALKRRERPSCVQGNLQQMADRMRRRLVAADCCEHDSDAASGASAPLRSRSDSDNDDGSGGLTASALPGMPEVRCRGPILGRIHHEFARLHDAGRLVAMATGDDDDDAGDASAAAAAASAGQLEDRIDWAAAVYHECLAAELGVVEAAVNLARLHLGLPTDCLQAVVSRSAIELSAQAGHRYMESAARLGDRSAMLYMARAHDSGNTAGLAQDWDRAAHYYQRALATSGQADREGGYDSLDTPGYLLRARLAELYLRGGHGLAADPAASYECYGEAAEEAMAEGNGKLAAKYYALAEEASAMAPDEEEPEE